MTDFSNYQTENHTETLQEVLLGALLVYPEYTSELELEHFSTEYQPAFAALKGYFDIKGTVDFTILAERYPEQAELLKRCCMAADDRALSRERVAAWVEELKKQCIVKQLQTLALQMAEDGTDLDTATNYFARMGSILDSGAERGGMESIGDCIDDYIRNFGNKPVRIMTGIKPLDGALHLVPGNFAIIGGRPSAGKTAFSLQMAVNMAKAGRKVVYFSLETDAKTLCSRAMANMLNIPLAAVKNKNVRFDELDRIADFKKMPLYLVEAAGKSVAWMKAQAVRAKADVIFIDYLQLIHQSGAKDRYSAVTEISMQLHTMAQTTGITVVALAQLNRNAAGTKPTNADLRESGQLEQDADAIILLSDDGSEYYAGLTKNKEGSPADLEIDFNKPMQQFVCRC